MGKDNQPKHRQAARDLTRRAATKERREQAAERARSLVETTTAHDGHQPFTTMHELVSRLVHLKD